ncbi:MAG: polysaccharide deacetylase family protein [Lentisphaerae bacterium]|nr:polysaccharide deacetylase family protein [Lentisphaerota bacterium]
MKQITTGFWPNAKPIAVTFSYDDGRIHDLQLIELLNKYGFKGTFHLNSGTIGKPGKVTEDEIRTHYTGHEVALHTVTHPQPTHTPDIVMLEEVLQDRRSLEEITGQIINGMSYPYGRWTAATCDILRACGIVYSLPHVPTTPLPHPPTGSNGTPPVTTVMPPRNSSLLALREPPGLLPAASSTSGVTAMSLNAKAAGKPLKLS